MVRKNQCTAKCTNKKRCRNRISGVNKSNGKHICAIHGRVQKIVEIVVKQEELNKCCFCDLECNPSSQACGRCARQCGKF